MKCLNMVQLIGNVGQEPEMKFTPNGKPVTTFSLATNRAWRDNSDNIVTETTWHKVVCWDKLAEAVNESVYKGDPVYVQGRLHTESWEKDGVKRTSTEVIGDMVIFLAKRRDGGKPTESAAPETVQPAGEPVPS